MSVLVCAPYRIVRRGVVRQEGERERKRVFAHGRYSVVAPAGIIGPVVVYRVPGNFLTAKSDLVTSCAPSCGGVCVSTRVHFHLRVDGAHCLLLTATLLTSMADGSTATQHTQYRYTYARATQSSHVGMGDKSFLYMHAP